MGDSLRSSKRRKLDTPPRNASSSLRKVSAKTASPAAPISNGNAESADEPSTRPRKPSRRLASTSNSTTNVTPRKSAVAVAEEKDVYDDIDGALPREGKATVASPAPSKARSARRRRQLALDPSLPHPFKSNPGSTTPSRSANTSALIGTSPGQRSFRVLETGFQNGVELESDIQDELAAAVSTPTKRTAKARQSNGIAGSSTGRPTRRTSQRPADYADDEESLDHLQSTGMSRATPKTTPSLKKMIGSGQAWKQPAGIEEEQVVAATPSRTSKQKAESEDELGTGKLRNRTRTAAERRRTNHTDHAGNRDDLNLSDGEQPTAGAEMDGIEGDAMSIDENSVLGSVLDPTEPSPFNRPSPVPVSKALAQVLHGGFTSGPELDLLKTIIMDRITGKRPVPLVGLEEEYKLVQQVVEHTITAGEGNSMLLIGARGSGKTALVNSVLAKAFKDHGEQYHVVRLNGFIHTDDKIALREIWRQLGKEMDIEDDGSLGKNYADTLTTLLALLSHPDEQAGELTDKVAKAVIFVMDEFDQFATHPRQTLLYNLFDIAQSRKAPIVVLGLTTRIDVANSLEKRVKSRFSHRYIHTSLAKTFTSFQQICKTSLLLQPDQLSIEERAILSATSTNPAKGQKGKKSSSKNVLSQWNSDISALFASQIFLTQHLAAHFYLTKSVPTALTSFLYPTAMLRSSTTLQPSNLLTPPDSKLSLLPSLSTLALSLLIAATRLDIIHDSDQCNFNMAYDEYVTLASKARVQSAAGGTSASGSVSKVWGKDVAKREWEGLVQLGLVVPVVQGQTGGFGMVKVDMSLVEIGEVLAQEKGVEKTLERWCRQL